MALDECLLITSAKQKEPAFYLREYRMPSTFSMGRIQSYDALKSVFSQKPSYRIVRRPTGGGLVQHDSDLVVSTVIPASDALYDWKVIDLYAFLHNIFAEVLESLAIQTCLNASSKDVKPELCFESPSQYDLLNADGSKKIVGSAIKKTKCGILIQSSLHCDLKKCEFSRLLIEKFKQSVDTDISSIDTFQLDRNEESWKQLVERHMSQSWKQKL